MSWNGSDQSLPTPSGRGAPPRRSKTRPPLSTSNSASTSPSNLQPPTSVFRGILAGLIVVAIAGAALWYFVLRTPQSRTTNRESRTTPSSRHIAVHEPHLPAATNAAPVEKQSEAPKEPVEMVKVNGKMVPRVVDGIVKYPPWGVGRNEVTGGVHRVKTLAEKTFDTAADLQIAGLLMIDPGESLVGDDEELIYRNFKKDFLEAIITPIIVSKDDSPDVAALKKAVIDTRLDLKTRLDNGEDIVQIMVETRREMRELGAYRDELNAELRRLETKEDMTEDDMRDFVTAANQMLENRGAKAISVPEITFERLKLRREMRQQEKSE